MNIPGVEGGNVNDKSFQEIMQRSFRVSGNSSIQNKDLDYRPAPVMSDYDVFDDRDKFAQSVGYNKTRGGWSSLTRDDIRPPGTEEYPQEDSIFNDTASRKRTFDSSDKTTDLNVSSDETRRDTSLSGSSSDPNVLPFPPKRSKDEPPLKIDYSSRFKFSCPDLTDSSLPNELKLQFQPLFCKLCSMTLSSNSMARMHYVSKNHNKKVKSWLVEYSERTGEPLHPRAVESNAKKRDQVENPSYYFCNVCNLPLTGKLHSESHYMGKQHQKAVLESRTPRNATAHSLPDICDNKKTLPFLNEHFAPADDGNDVNEGVNLVCELCSVRVTCKEQLEQHLHGAKHKKKLKQTQNISSAKGSPEYAEYRTPSGFFYCSVCKVTVNSTVQFKAHQESKKHRNKSGL